MNERPPSPLLSWFVSSRGITSAALVAITAVWLAVYTANVFVEPVTPSYPLDFGNARWIVTPQNGSPPATGFYRKNFYVTGTVKHAWIMVTAPDAFTVYINGKPLPGSTPGAAASGATGALMPASPTALEDITTYLTPGTNTIAVYVSTSTYIYPSCFRLRGRIEYEMNSQEFVSDTTWRASSYPGLLETLMNWTEVKLDDQQWPFAQYYDFPDKSLIQPIKLPPWLLQEEVQAHWISAFSQIPQRATFSTQFDVPRGAKDCWLQISSQGKNRVAINGSLMSNTAEESTVVDSPGDLDIHFYWIQPWIKRGTNQIVIRVDDPRDAPTLLAQVTYRNAEGKVTHVVTNQDWRVAGIDGKDTPAVDLGKFSNSGLVLGMPAMLNFPSPYIASVLSQRYFERNVLIVLVTLAFILLHVAVADFFRSRGAPTDSLALGLDAILHFPILFALVVLSILYYDVHLQPEWTLNATWLLVLVLAWLGLRLWAASQLRKAKPLPEDKPWYFWEWIQYRKFGTALFLITLASFGLRVSGLSLFDLDADEILIRYCAHGILERGYPSGIRQGVEIRLTTYEFLPFPIALSAIFFGWSDWAVRIPAMLFGVFTTWNIGRMGRELFNPAVGLLVAFCYMICPWTVYYARHIIHPSQDQFFALLTFWSFYRAVRVVGNIDRIEFYKSCIYFSCLYLTWEGSGFVLPICGIMLLIMQEGNWRWLRQLHVYVGFLMVCFVVILELSARTVKSPSFLTLGYGLTGVTPKPVFLSQIESVAFYVSGIIREQCNLPYTLAYFLGVFFVFHHRAMRYVLVLFGLLIFTYSNFLQIYQNRYFYFYETLLMLGGCAVIVYALEAVYDLARDQTILMARRVAYWTCCLVLAFFITLGSTLGFRILGLITSSEDVDTHYWLYWQDARGACEFVASHLRPGDIVSGSFNYSYFYFTGNWVNFTQNQFLDQMSIYDIQHGKNGAFENMYVRIKVVFNERDFAKMYSQCRRMWYIESTTLAPGPDVIVTTNSFVIHRSRLVYAGSMINVYLADGMATKTGEKMEDPGLPANALDQIVTPATVTGSKVPTQK